MSISFHRVWQPDKIVEMLREALGVVDAVEPADDLRPAVFAAAAQLASTVVPQQMESIPVDLAALTRKNHDLRG